LEYLTAGQALSFHAPESLACGTRAALALLREHVDVYTEDRILAPDIAAVTAIIQGEEGIGRVEAQLTHPDNPLRTDWIDGVAVATGRLHAVQGLVGGAHQVFRWSPSDCRRWQCRCWRVRAAGADEERRHGVDDFLAQHIHFQG
jgi:hypothetical protein